jgi:hypothetical protein
LYTLGKQYSRPYQKEDVSAGVSGGFSENNIVFMINTFAYENAHRLRRAITKMPYVRTIEEIDDKDVLNKLVETVTDEEKPLKLVYKMAFYDKTLQASMANLKMLSRYDPFLGWGLSFAYDRIAYVMMIK